MHHKLFTIWIAEGGGWGNFLLYKKFEEIYITRFPVVFKGYATGTKWYSNAAT